jgi:5-methylcytosine-specific restriction endonuclease McrA
MFEVDHVVLHAHGGSDRWHNLDPKLKAMHREKSRRDTGIAAKGKRLDRKWSDFMRRISAGKKPVRKKSKWPSRPMRQQRGR